MRISIVELSLTAKGRNWTSIGLEGPSVNGTELGIDSLLSLRESDNLSIPAISN